jgi:hypothetical protein
VGEISFRGGGVGDLPVGLTVVPPSELHDAIMGTMNVRATGMR